MRRQKSDLAKLVGQRQILFRAEPYGVRADLQLGAKHRVCDGE
jgi:hypothetical protein